MGHTLLSAKHTGSNDILTVYHSLRVAHRLDIVRLRDFVTSCTFLLHSNEILMAVAFIQASRRLKVIVYLTIDTSEDRQCIRIRKTNVNPKSYCSSLILRGSIYQGDLDSV